MKAFLGKTCDHDEVLPHTHWKDSTVDCPGGYYITPDDLLATAIRRSPGYVRSLVPDQYHSPGVVRWRIVEKLADE